MKGLVRRWDGLQFVLQDSAWGQPGLACRDLHVGPIHRPRGADPLLRYGPPPQQPADVSARYQCFLIRRKSEEMDFR